MILLVYYVVYELISMWWYSLSFVKVRRGLEYYVFDFGNVEICNNLKFVFLGDRREMNYYKFLILMLDIKCLLFWRNWSRFINWFVIRKKIVKSM